MAASGTATNRTNIELPTQVSNEILQKAQEQSAIMRMARKIALPGWGLTIPVITSDPEAEWVSETGVKPVKNPGLDKKVMQAYKLAVIVPFSNEFKRDTANLYNALVGRLPLALARKFDGTCFFGSAPGSNFDTLASVTAQNLAGEKGVWQALIDADMAIAAQNADLNGFVISPTARGILLGETDNQGRPLFVNSTTEGSVPVVLGRRTVSSRAAYQASSGNDPAVVGFAGDWTQAMYGIVQGMKVDISDQATLTTKDQSNNTVTINLWQQNMFAVRAEIEVGFRCDTNCFNKLTYAPAAAAAEGDGE